LKNEKAQKETLASLFFSGQRRRGEYFCQINNSKKYFSQIKLENTSDSVLQLVDR